MESRPGVRDFSLSFEYLTDEYLTYDETEHQEYTYDKRLFRLQMEEDLSKVSTVRTKQILKDSPSKCLRGQFDLEKKEFREEEIFPGLNVDTKINIEDVCATYMSRYDYSLGKYIGFAIDSARNVHCEGLKDCE